MIPSIESYLFLSFFSAFWLYVKNFSKLKNANGYFGLFFLRNFFISDKDKPPTNKSFYGVVFLLGILGGNIYSDFMETDKFEDVAKRSEENLKLANQRHGAYWDSL